jgi:hypothetical protein
LIHGLLVESLSKEILSLIPQPLHDPFVFVVPYFDLFFECCLMFLKLFEHMAMLMYVKRWT